MLLHNVLAWARLITILIQGAAGACRLLRIAESVVLLKRYIDSRSLPHFGSVCNAFAVAVGAFLLDWKLFVTSLETNLRNSDWSLIRITSHCQQVVSPLHTTAGVWLHHCALWNAWMLDCKTACSATECPVVQLLKL